MAFAIGCEPSPDPELMALHKAVQSHFNSLENRIKTVLETQSAVGKVTDSIPTEELNPPLSFAASAGQDNWWLVDTVDLGMEP